MDFQLWNNRNTLRYANMYQAARDEGLHLEAFYALFHLQVDDTFEEDGSPFKLYMENKMTCAVCLGQIQKGQGALTKCFHVFCRVCLDQWMQDNRTCPMCREHVCKYRLPVKSDAFMSRSCSDTECPDAKDQMGIARMKQALALYKLCKRPWRPTPKRFF